MGLHVHTFTVEPGSPADGKSVRELELKTRFGIGDMGLRSGNMTISNVPGSTVLSAGDVVILFIPDAKAREIVHLFAGTEPLGQPGL
jgi:uncharacterized protein with PhoU and TrkA domain